MGSKTVITFANILFSFTQEKKEKVMDLLPLKMAPFYTFLICFLLLETLRCARVVCSGKEFQAGEQAVPEY